MSLRFFWNGIKGSDGKLQRCSYSDGKLYHHPEGTITIYAKHYRDFSAEVRQQFQVENNSDMQTDYFENDSIRVTPDHPLYGQVKAALAARNAHYDKPRAKRSDKALSPAPGSPEYERLKARLAELEAK